MITLKGASIKWHRLIIITISSDHMKWIFCKMAKIENLCKIAKTEEYYDLNSNAITTILIISSFNRHMQSTISDAPKTLQLLDFIFDYGVGASTLRVNPINGYITCEPL